MSAEFSIFKSDDDKRLVFGWASVAIRADGTQIEDWQGDMIDPDDLEEAVYEYVLNFRDAGEEHIPTMRKKGKLVESVVFTKEKMKAMGIPEGIVPEGWWIGFKVHDDEAWAKIKSGEYRMFSIEGSGVREPVVQKSVTFRDILTKFNPNHDPATGRFTSGSAMGGISRRTMTGGGISINIKTGKEPKTGYMVAVHSERAVWISASDAKDPQKRLSIMKKFKEDNADVLSQKDNYFGTWLDPETGEISLDISKCISDRDVAVEYARAHNEKAIWDVERMENIDTGGTGKN